jgi:membrane protein implicated in regulation of membrane protease activity
MLPSFGLLGFSLSALIMTGIIYYFPEFLSLNQEVFLFSALSIVMVFAVFKLLYKSEGEPISDPIIGKRVIISKKPTEDNPNYQVKYSGSLFNAETKEQANIGEIFVIEEVEGNIFKIRKDKKNEV